MPSPQKQTRESVSTYVRIRISSKKERKEKKQGLHRQCVDDDDIERESQARRRRLFRLCRRCVLCVLSDWIKDPLFLRRCWLWNLGNVTDLYNIILSRGLRYQTKSISARKRGEKKKRKKNERPALQWVRRNIHQEKEGRKRHPKLYGTNTFFLIPKRRTGGKKKISFIIFLLLYQYSLKILFFSKPLIFLHYI